MDTGRLKGILESEIDSSIGFIESETTDERKRSLEYYQRHDYGNEVEGRSQIVTSEVAEAVDGALPQIMRIFTQTKNFVDYMPRTQEDEEGAQQATDYANWVLEQNQGVILFHNWFKDALLQKVGVVKAFWDTQEDVTEEEYNNLTDDELAMIMRDDTREIVEKESLEQSVDAGEDITIQVASHNVKVKRKKHVKHLHEVLTPKEETEQCTYVNRDVNACKNILYIAKYWLMNQKLPEEFKRKIHFSIMPIALSRKHFGKNSPLMNQLIILKIEYGPKM